MFFILSKALAFLFSPFVWFIFCVLAAFFWKKEIWRKRFKWIALGLFFFFSNSVIYLEFCRLWEVHGTPIKKVKNYDVGIVLTGMGEYNADLNVVSLRRGGDRIWQAVTLYHKGKVKQLLITGDNGYVTKRGLHEAKQLKEVLVGWGIPEKDIITEEKSRNTHENATETQKIINRSYPHFNSFLLITSGTHMRRARACFAKINMNVDCYSTDLYTGPTRGYHWDQFIIPDVSNFDCWNHLTKEWVGYVVYDVVGYI